MSQIDRTQEHLIEVYRKKAKHYDLTSRLYPVPGYPQQAHRHRAVRALGLRAGDSVIDIACGTGLNFPLIEKMIGPEGRIIGVDMTDAMLAQAQNRVDTNLWRNISLVQADVADFDFPAEVDAILSTYALTQVPRCAVVISRGAAALSDGRRWVVLDLKVPDNTPRWLAQLGIAIVRPFAAIDQWMAHRPWEAIRASMQADLADLSWTELCFGTAFLAAGSRARGTSVLGAAHHGLAGQSVGRDDASPEGESSPAPAPGDLFAASHTRREGRLSRCRYSVPSRPVLASITGRWWFRRASDQTRRAP